MRMKVPADRLQQGDRLLATDRVVLYVTHAAVSLPSSHCYVTTQRPSGKQSTGMWRKATIIEVERPEVQRTIAPPVEVVQSVHVVTVEYARGVASPEIVGVYQDRTRALQLRDDMVVEFMEAGRRVYPREGEALSPARHSGGPSSWDVDINVLKADVL